MPPHPFESRSQQSKNGAGHVKAGHRRWCEKNVQCTPEATKMGARQPQHVVRCADRTHRSTTRGYKAPSFLPETRFSGLWSEITPQRSSRPFLSATTRSSVSSMPHDTLTNPSVIPNIKLTDHGSERVADGEELDGGRGKVVVTTLGTGGGWAL